MSEQPTPTGVIANKNKTPDRSSRLQSKNGFKTDSIYFKVKVPQQIVKRDGRITSFDVDRIDKALRRCYSSLQNEPKTSAHRGRRAGYCRDGSASSRGV
jgi:hypothetical protein